MKKMAGGILRFKKKWIWVDLKKEKKKASITSDAGLLGAKMESCFINADFALSRRPHPCLEVMGLCTVVVSFRYWGVGVDLPGIVEGSDVSWVPAFFHYWYLLWIELCIPTFMQKY